MLLASSTKRGSQFARRVRYAPRKLYRNLTRKLADNDSRTCRAIISILSLVDRKCRAIRHLRLRWLDEADEFKYVKLAEAAITQSYGPAKKGKSQVVVPIHLPSIYLYRFPDARVTMDSSSFVLGNQEVLIERLETVDTSSCCYAGGQIWHHNQQTAVVHVADAIDLDRGIFLGGNGSFNYYHWLIEIIPRLFHLSRLPREFRDYPLLVNEDVEKYPSFKDALNHYVGAQQIRPLKKKASYRIRDLLHVTTPNLLPFNLKQRTHFEACEFQFRSEAVAFLREGSTRRPTSVGRPTKRVFLARKPQRRNYNQDQALDISRRYGFIPVFMEDLGFPEQISTMQDSEIIIGPTGGAWTNLVFCNPGTRALCWMADEYGDFSAFSNLAQLSGVNLEYLTYPTGATTTHELYNATYRLDLKMFEEALLSIVSA